VEFVAQGAATASCDDCLISIYTSPLRVILTVCDSDCKKLDLLVADGNKGALKVHLWLGSLIS